VYPTRIRSSGVGTVLGIGRIGSVLGPLAGGAMLHLGWPISIIFAVIAVPGVVSAFGIWVTGRLPRNFP
jgi:AAHS family 4-hydroxybenzoate transporter-like MFS transporter